MDRREAIPLSPLHRENALPQPQGSFAGAHNFTMFKPVFNDNSGSVQENIGLDHLLQFISEDALYDSSARFPPPRCHPGTRERVVQIITSWVDDPDPRERILWLNGPAGAGKSAIAQTIAEQYRDGGQLAGSFFFLRNAKDRGVVDRLFLTLAWQLARSIPETRPYIESALKEEPLLHKKSIDVQFDRLFVKVFEQLRKELRKKLREELRKKLREELREELCEELGKELGKEGKKVREELRKKLRECEPNWHPKGFLVIIDGVDECAPERDQRTFLSLIGDALASGGIPLRFLICSRPEFQIQATFDMEKMANATYRLALDDSFKPNDDIQRYLEDNFRSIFTKHKVSPFPSAADIHHLVSKASGQFIYASTVIRFIDDDDCNPKEQLDIILKLRARSDKSSSPYALLDELYLQILSQQKDTRLLRDVLVLVIALDRPDMGFICRRLRIRKEDLRVKLRRMHSLLQISDSGIETYHKSLHDFLRDKARARNYYIHPLRVALVRLPQKTRGYFFGDCLFVEWIRRGSSDLLDIFSYSAPRGLVLIAGRMLLTPLIMVPAICFGVIFPDAADGYARVNGCCGLCLYISLFFPLGY